MVQQEDNYYNSTDEELEEEEIIVRRPNDKKVILHVDADCYEYQVWMKKNHPELEGTNEPAVVANLDGIMLAVNYPARKLGVTRKPGRKALEDAIELCPELKIIITGTKEGVVDTDTPLEESDKMIRVFKTYRKSLKKEDNFIFEMSSRDEFYIDVTGLVSSRMASQFRKDQSGDCFIKGFALPSEDDIDMLTSSEKEFPDQRFSGNPETIMEGRKGTITRSTLKHRVRRVYPMNLEDYHYDEARLIFGAVIAKTLMRQVKLRTGYDISVGVAHNKLTAKMACTRNKPQGITILPDAAIPRLMKKLEFQDLPGFKGEKGKILREEYERQTRKKLVTLQDVQMVGVDRLEQILKSTEVSQPESTALELFKKSSLRDDEAVHIRYYADTVGQTMSFKWKNAVYSWPQFVERVQALGRLFKNKLDYRVKSHRRLTTQCCVKVELKKNARTKTRSDQNSMELQQLPTAEEISNFVLNYIRANQLEFSDIVQLGLTGTKLVPCK